MLFSSFLFLFFFNFLDSQTRERESTSARLFLSHLRSTTDAFDHSNEIWRFEITRVVSSGKIDYDLKDLLPVFDCSPLLYCCRVHTREKVPGYPRDLFTKLQRTIIKTWG